MILDTERLRLRPIETKDVDAIFALRSDAAVTRYLLHAPFTERAQAEARVAMLIARVENRVWAITRPEEDALLGTITLFGFEREHKRCELGFELLPSAQGHGYAYEAVKRVIQHAFDFEGLERLEADADPRNTASRRLLERLGFVLEGTMRARWIVNGEVCDTAFYGLLRKDFAAILST